MKTYCIIPLYQMLQDPSGRPILMPKNLNGSPNIPIPQVQQQAQGMMINGTFVPVGSSYTMPQTTIQTNGNYSTPVGQGGSTNAVMQLVQFGLNAMGAGKH